LELVTTQIVFFCNKNKLLNTTRLDGFVYSSFKKKTYQTESPLRKRRSQFKCIQPDETKECMVAGEYQRRSLTMWLIDTGKSKQLPNISM